MAKVAPSAVKAQQADADDMTNDTITAGLAIRLANHSSFDITGLRDGG